MFLSYALMRRAGVDLLSDSFYTPLLVSLLGPSLPRFNSIHSLSLVRDHSSHQRSNETDDLVAISRPCKPLFRAWGIVLSQCTSSFDSVPLSWLLDVFTKELLASSTVQEVAYAVEQPQLDHVSISLAAVANTVLPLGKCRVEHVRLGLGLKLQEILGAELEGHEQLRHGRSCVFAIRRLLGGASEEGSGGVDACCTSVVQ
jgi:hypothetical protein